MCTPVPSLCFLSGPLLACLKCLKFDDTFIYLLKSVGPLWGIFLITCCFSLQTILFIFITSLPPWLMRYPFSALYPTAVIPNIRPPSYLAAIHGTPSPGLQAMLSSFFSYVLIVYQNYTFKITIKQSGTSGNQSPLPVFSAFCEVVL